MQRPSCTDHVTSCISRVNVRTTTFRGQRITLPRIDYSEPHSYSRGNGLNNNNNSSDCEIPSFEHNELLPSVERLALYCQRIRSGRDDYVYTACHLKADTLKSDSRQAWNPIVVAFMMEDEMIVIVATLGY